MRVYFIRHGIAVPGDSPGVLDDAARELTSEGISKMRKAMRGLSALEVDLDRIWSSPLARARQSAVIVADAFPDAGSVRTLRALAPEGKLDRVVAILAENAALEDVALVGHEPSLSELIGLLLTGRRASVVQLKKGGAACVEVESPIEPGRATLLWLLTPRQLRALA